MNLKDKIKAIFAKAQDEAMNLAADADSDMPPKKDAKDEEKKDDAKKDDSKDAASYDELVKMVKDLGEKISSMAKPKDDAGNPAAGEEDKPAAKDEDVAPALEDRLKALEASVAKLLEAKASAGDEDSEESMDDDDGDNMDAEDDDFEESTMTGDTASRVEILAPGLKASAKDAKAQALKAAYATKDGKAVIDQLTGGKAPELKDETRVNTLFIAASELLKASRTEDFSKTKQNRVSDSQAGAPKGPMTAEEMNAINAKYYGKQN